MDSNIMDNKQIMENYKQIAEFLYQCFLDNCEIVVHDFTDINNSIVAIYNGEISSRGVGAPVTDFALEIIKNKRYKQQNYVANYTTVSNTGKKLRSATYFIKNEEGDLLGLLCINIDVSIYEETSKILSRLIKGPAPQQSTVVEEEEEVGYTLQVKEGIETFSASVDEMVETIIYKETTGIPVDRLHSDEKMELVRILNEKGVFMLKGGVASAAKALAISEATVYRYLSKLKNSMN